MCAPLLFAVNLLFLGAALGSAQTTAPASLQSLDFLPGIWIADGPWQPAPSTEFHWVNNRGNAMLVGRFLAGDERTCPWCVTEAAMLAYRDPASGEVHVRFGDKVRRALDFRLVSAHEKSAELLTVPGAGLPARRLTLALLPADVLLITLEEAESNRQGGFSTLARWKLHRRHLIQRIP